MTPALEGVKLWGVEGLTRELGRYASAEGERVLCAVRPSGRSAWAVTDDLVVEGEGDARLVEPAVDSLVQEAIARDYLPRARGARRPLRREPAASRLALPYAIGP